MRQDKEPSSSSGKGDVRQDITNRIIAQIEAGIIPWVQPWASGGSALSLPHNTLTRKTYSGINIVILWDALFNGSYAVNHWLTFKQALALGGQVRKGERGTAIVFTDSFVPKKTREAARNTDEPQRISFLKRSYVFNVAQCDGLPHELTVQPVQPAQRLPSAAADSVIRATAANIQIGGGEAYYNVSHDFIRVPDQTSFYEPINYYRTVLHELSHWSGAAHRLARDYSKRFGDEAYAREELVAELGAAFLCATLGIIPTVRHADYIGNWLRVLKNDSRAIISAASHASKASDFILGCTERAAVSTGRAA